MTQYVINIGALPNDGTGDPLRTAFNETNLNFDQVFAAGPVLSNVRIANNTILTTTTNGNLILAPNGIGRIQANATIVPSVANVRDLGSADRRWSTVYAQYANISGELTVANFATTGNVTVGGNLTVTGNIINVANIVTDAKTIQLSNTAGTANAANGSGITVGANDNIATFLYTSVGNRWNTNVGLQVAGASGLQVAGTANVALLSVNQTANAWIIGGNTITAPSGAFWNSDYINRDEYITSALDGYINIISQYANGNTASQLHLEHGLATIEVNNGSNQVWFFDDTGNLTVPGNIMPAANVTYSLGNATNRWANLWLSGNTIQLGDLSLSAGANGLTSTSGFDLENSTAANIEATGNITANYFFGNGSQLTGLNTTTSNISNGTSNVDIPIANGNVIINNSGTYAWTFDNTGNLTVPGTIISASTINIDNRALGNSADIQLFAADDITLQARDRTLGSGSEGGDINIYAGDSAEDGDSSGGDIQIIAGDGGAANVDFGGAGGFITIRSGQGGAAIGDGVSSAESGGALTLQAGDAGGNNGNIDRGAAGGDVFITAGDSTGNLDAGGDIVLTTGTGGSNAPAGNVIIIIPSSDQGAGGTWTFDGTGNLIVPSNGNINASDGSTARFQSLDEGIVRSSVTLAPADGLTRLESFDNQDSNGYTTSDWATGEYVNNGGSGEIVFTDAPAIISFFSTIDTSRVFYQVNGGNLLPSSGYGSGGNNITFYTAIPPVASPTTVTTFTIYYSNRSVIEMDYDEGEMNLNARNLDINITSDQSIDFSTRDIIRLQNTGNSSGVAIITDAGNAFHTWNFQANGNLALPAGGLISEGPSPSYLGNAVTITPANGGDPNQQLKIYPTAAEGNHLHLTSGNLQVTDVFLGDDSQYIRTTTTGGMIVGTGGGEIFGGYAWSFEENGNLIFPDGSSIGGGAFNGTASSTVSLNAFSPDGNTVSFQAQGNTSSAVISIFSNAGPVTSNWTFTTAPLDPSESFLYVPPGGTITTTNASSGEGGKNIFIQAGASDPVTWNSNPGGELFIKGGYGSFGDGGGGAGGNVNIEGGTSSDSHAGNVNITCGPNSWVFDYSGNVTIPGNINAVLSSPAPSLNGFNSVNSVNVNASGNISGGNISTSGRLSATGNIVTGGQIQSTAFTGGNISWAANNRTDFQGAIKVGGTGQILSPGGAASITLNNNGANIPTLGVTIGTAATSTTTGALIVTGGAGLTGNLYVGGNIVGNTAGFAIGYRDIPQVSFTGNATIATTDAGKHFYSTQSSNFTLTIANNASQGFQIGAAITVVNQGTGTISIAQGSGVTLYLAGNATSGNRSVSTFGMATIMKVATDTWFINGTGVS
jgi:hypothetical protein